ncbi:MAG TPA: hypothetical protein VKK79_00705, partial [Candidatus Lokiarchaeia archaeon]|nr:hypothetical protein [Candidatus Lokiarchaeia archaeon]
RCKYIDLTQVLVCLVKLKPAMLAIEAPIHIAEFHRFVALGAVLYWSNIIRVGLRTCCEPIVLFPDATHVLRRFLWHFLHFRF